jgi:hypothetical protein
MATKTHMHRIRALFAGLFFLAVSSIGSAQVPAGFKQLTLPELPNVTQRLEAPAPTGWKPLNDPQLAPQLSQVTVYDGHPSELASLVPDNVARFQRDKFGVYARWAIKTTRRSTWIVTSYTSTNIALAYELPREVKEIRVYYGRGMEQPKAVFFR